MDGTNDDVIDNREYFSEIFKKKIDVIIKEISKYQDGSFEKSQKMNELQNIKKNYEYFKKAF